MYYRIYDHDNEPIPPDELATCIALLQGAKIRAEKYISSPWGQSFLDKSGQKLIDITSSAIDEAVVNLEALREVLK